MLGLSSILLTGAACVAVLLSIFPPGLLGGAASQAVFSQPLLLSAGCLVLALAAAVTWGWWCFRGAESHRWWLRQVLRLLGLAPLLVLGWRSSVLLFQGRRLLEYQRGGLGPVVLFLVATAASLWVVSQLVRLARSGRVGLAVTGGLLVAAALGLMYWDAKWLPDYYPHLHDLGRAAFLLALTTGLLCLSIVMVGGRLRPPGLAAFCLMALSAIALLFVVRQSATNWSDTEKTRIFRHWRIGRTLSPLLFRPMEGPHEEPSVSFSERARAHLEARKLARERLTLSKPKKPVHVLLVTMDAVRADALFATVDGKKTTPFLETIREGCFEFTETRSPAVGSYLSLGATLSGTSPMSLHQRRGLPLRWLADHLETVGYTTAACWSPSILATRDPAYGDREEDFGFNATTRTDHLESGVDWILEHLSAASTPKFLWVHAMDAHFPYARKAPYRFGTGLKGRYLEAVRRLDSQLRRLFEELAARDLLDHSLIVLAADHGEAFGERGQRFHGSSLQNCQTHVPFFIHAPWIGRNVTRDEAVTTQSLPGTIADIVGIDPLPGEEVESLSPYLNPGSVELDGIAVSERPSKSNAIGVSTLRSLVHDGWKLDRDLLLNTSALFRPVEDPTESNDLAEKHPDIRERMLELESSHLGDRRCYRKRWGGDELPEEEAVHVRLLNRVKAGELKLLPELLEYLDAPDQPVRREVGDALFLLWFHRGGAGGLAPNVLLRQKPIHEDEHLDACASLLEVAIGRRPLDERAAEMLCHLPRRLASPFLRFMAARVGPGTALPALAAVREEGRLDHVGLPTDLLLACGGSKDAARRLLSAYRSTVVHDVRSSSVAGILRSHHAPTIEALLDTVDKEPKERCLLVYQHMQPVLEVERRWLYSQISKGAAQGESAALGGLLRSSLPSPVPVAALISSHELEVRRTLLPTCLVLLSEHLTRWGRVALSRNPEHAASMLDGLWQARSGDGTRPGMLGGLMWVKPEPEKDILWHREPGDDNSYLISWKPELGRAGVKLTLVAADGSRISAPLKQLESGTSFVLVPPEVQELLPTALLKVRELGEGLVIPVARGLIPWPGVPWSPDMPYLGPEFAVPRLTTLSAGESASFELMPRSAQPVSIRIGFQGVAPRVLVNESPVAPKSSAPDSISVPCTPNAQGLIALTLTATGPCELLYLAPQF